MKMKDDLKIKIDTIEESVKTKIKDGTFIKWAKDKYEIEECSDSQALSIAKSAFAEAAMDNIAQACKDCEDITNSSNQLDLLENILTSVAAYSAIRKTILEKIDGNNKDK